MLKKGDGEIFMRRPSAIRRRRILERKQKKCRRTHRARKTNETDTKLEGEGNFKARGRTKGTSMKGLLKAGTKKRKK